MCGQVTYVDLEHFGGIGILPSATVLCDGNVIVQEFDECNSTRNNQCRYDLKCNGPMSIVNSTDTTNKYMCTQWDVCGKETYMPDYGRYIGSNFSLSSSNCVNSIYRG